MKKLEGKKIQLKGFLMPDFNEKLMLSRSDGYFFCCGGFGPADVVGLEFGDPLKFPVKNPVVLEGVLKLNSDDPFRHLYILENVRCLDCKSEPQKAATTKS